MKLKPLHRFAEVRAAALDAEARTLRLSFSSETPVDRWFGAEVLDHGKAAVRMDRLNNGAPLLFNHDMNDVIGVVEGAEIGSDRRGYADVRFAKTARADEVFGMVLDNVLRNVSLMYRVHSYDVEPKTDTYRATDWEPMEISIVTVPADPSVGVGRSAEAEEREVTVRSIDNSAAVAAASKGAIMADEIAAAGASADIQVLDHQTAAQLERGRVSALQRLATQYQVEVPTLQRWIDAGTSLDDAGKEVVKLMADRSKASESRTKLDLSRRETAKYSMMRAINAVINKSWDKAGLELEASQEIARRMGRHVNEHTFFVPLDIQQRDLIVGTSTMGGFLVGTGNVGFIELLRNRSVLFNMGATRLSGLQGSVAVPRQTAAGTGYWLANEATAITESQMVIGQMTLTPKNVGGYTEISRQLLLQSSPDAEMLVMNDLAAVVALAVDSAGISGPGTGGQPAGITATSGIGGVTITTGTVSYGNVLEFQTDAAAANALTDRSGYVTTPAIAAILKQKARFSNTDTPIWQGNLLNGNIEGLRAMSSNQMASGQLLMGDFSQVVVGEWGVLEVEANPYANFAAGIVGVRAFYTVDVGVRYPGAFSLGTGITA
jgi:HK97 family phage major capsid protein/HK97 family phage prohead protease